MTAPAGRMRQNGRHHTNNSRGWLTGSRSNYRRIHDEFACNVACELRRKPSSEGASYGFSGSAVWGAFPMTVTTMGDL